MQRRVGNEKKSAWVYCNWEAYSKWKLGCFIKSISIYDKCI